MIDTTRKNTTAGYLTALLCVIVAVAADQVTKWFAVTNLKENGPYVLIDGVFELRYLENRGAAFGMFQNCQIFFSIGAILMIAVVAYLYRKMPYTGKYLPLRICAVLICAGAAGNLIDRVRLNYVVDFLYFSLIDFPIFNVADCYVVIACIAFAVLLLFYYKEDNDFAFLNRKQEIKP